MKRNKNTNKSKLLSIIILAILIITIAYFNTGDRYTIRIEKKAALAYIYNKYKIRPHVTSFKIHKECMGFLFIGCHGAIEEFGTTFKMKYKNKTFNLYVPNNYSQEKSKYKFKNIVDDYQLKNIKKDYVKTINNIINKKPYEYEIEFSNNNEYTSNMFKKYYDGNNIEEVLEGMSINFTFNYIDDADLLNAKELLKNSTLLTAESIDSTGGYFIQFNSLKDYNDNKKRNYEFLEDMSSKYDPLFTKIVLEVNYYKGNKQEEYHDYGNLKELPFPYAIENIKNNNIDEKASNSIIKTYDDNLEGLDDNYIIISPIYTIDYSASDSLLGNKIYLYIKKDEIKDFKENEKSEYQLARIIYENNEKKIRIEKNIKEIEEYLRPNSSCYGHSICEKEQMVIVKKKNNM